MAEEGGVELQEDGLRICVCGVAEDGGLEGIEESVFEI